ncbi:MAG TPA: hypothetical protein VNO51_08675 [Ilumatobacteraceae bacterium]|nr:hypothetical protein [Ilumatobacteraceae bacterium]
MGGAGGNPDEYKQTSDEMSEPDFIRYQADLERVAQRKGYGLVATDTPRRFVCSDSPEDIRSATGGQSLERIEAFLARRPDMWD